MTEQQFPSHTISPIGFIRTPYKQKFAIPRQPNLAPIVGRIDFCDAIDVAACCHGLDKFSHLWLMFIFHETSQRGWKARVKAPRLGGNHTLGVFASRSTHRPNGLGLSVVKQRGLVTYNNSIQLEVEGVDLLDGTPIVDIKPYLPYSDSVTNAIDQLTQQYPHRLREVVFLPTVKALLQSLSAVQPELQRELTAILAQDPRPAYRQHIDNDERTYFLALYDYDIAWRVVEKQVLVCEIKSNE